ncbi:hypothetical protein ACOSP7_012359 [Xanthoceras sorbifolium]
MIMKRGIPEAFKGPESEGITTANEFLAEIEKRFVKNDKVETSTLLASLISMNYKGKGNIREYIMKMSHIASKLKTLKLELSNNFLVHLVLISFSVQFSQFKVSYNCQKEKWTLNELISYCVQEEDRLKQEKTESVHLASTSKDKGKKRKKDHEVVKGPFAKFLEECGIVPRYTMPGSLSMKGVAERLNRTLKDMVRSMISHSTLPESLWGRSIKDCSLYP